MTQVETGTTVFGDRLVDCVDRRRSQLVLGLDPVLDMLPVELQGEAGDGPAARGDAIARFCRGLIDAAAPMCVAVRWCTRMRKAGIHTSQPCVAAESATEATAIG